MFLRILPILVSLCVWAGLGGGFSLAKVVRRRGLGTFATMAGEKKPCDQLELSFDKTKVPLVRFKDFVAHDLGSDTKYAAHTRITQSSSTVPVSSSKEIWTQTEKLLTKLDERPIFSPGFSTSVSVGSGTSLDFKESRNTTKSPSLKPKQLRADKAHTFYHKVDLSLLSNKTRLKPFMKSRVKADPVVHTTAAQGRALILDSPRKSNLSSADGLKKQSPSVQPQKGSTEEINYVSKTVKSRKQEVITQTPSHSLANFSVDFSTQDRTATPESPNMGNQTDYPDLSLMRNPAESVNASIVRKNKHLTVRTTLIAQSTVTANTEKNLIFKDLGSVFQEAESSHVQTVSTLPLGVYSDTKTKIDHSRSDTSNFRTGRPGTGSTLDFTDGAVLVDAGHILKLRPEPSPVRDVTTETDENRVTVEPGLGEVGRGLMFQEAESETEVNGQGQDGDESRSRRRRSWIWNQFFVIEEYSGPEPVLIGRLHTDMDRGDGRTKYVLRGEGAGSVFVIDEKTGNIHVTKPLDREEKDEYRLIATATDRQTDRPLEPSSQFVIRVQDINDNPPVFQDGPYSATVPEMANIGTSIIQVTATDADDPTYGNSAKLVYTLLQGQQYFSVDPQTGILRTAVPDMDRESQDQYLVVLQAKDMGGHLGGLTGTTTVTVKLTDVNDNPPRFTQSMWSFSVSELAIPGAEVGRISAMDADLGDNAKLEYTILEGETGDTFNITGQNQEAVITLNKVVDYESRSSYSFSVEVLNPTVDPRFLRRGPFKDRASVRVAVMDADEPPRFSRARYRLDVSENCPSSCTVGRVSAVDPDTGLSSNIRFSIDPQSDPEALFRIAPDSGLITTAMELDREREQWHNITIIATQRDSPTQVSRVVVAIETLDVNDNAPELDRQYTTALCDSASVGQVVQVLRAIDKDKGGNDTAVHFSIPPDSTTAFNFSVRESGGPTASLVLLSPLLPLSRSQASPVTLQVPLILKDSFSGLTSTGTVTVSVCPCLRGGARAGEKEGHTEGEWERETVCLPMAASSSSPGLSTAALLAILACVATLLAVSALSLSLRRQKRDSLSPLEEDDVRENIITYDDEGGGEADTAAFDITALQSAPHGACRGYRTLDSRNIRYAQHAQDKTRGYRWVKAGLDPQYPSSAAPLYGRLCYSSHTLPALRHSHSVFEPGLPELAYRYPSGHLDHSLVIQNQGAIGGPLNTGAVCVVPADAAAARGTTSRAAPPSAEGKEKVGVASTGDQNQNIDWVRSSEVQSESLPTDQTLVVTRSGRKIPAGQKVAGAWGCDSATLPLVGRRALQAGQSPQRGTATPPDRIPGDTLGSAPSSSDVNESTESHPGSFSHSTGNILQGEPHRDYPGSLGRGGLEMGSSFVRARPPREGGVSVTGTAPGMFPEATAYIPDWRNMAGYVLGRRDMIPQLLPFPDQNRGMLGQMGYRAGWGMGPEVGRGGGGSLALRVGEFLRLRLAQVTFDPAQPPYDSVQIYGLEGEGSQAGSLSSLESEEEKEAELEWGGALEEWGPPFQRLAELFREREREKEEEEHDKEDDRQKRDEGKGGGAKEQRPGSGKKEMD
ncbi:cadherin-24 isoform X1 [Arapaima gigas]